MAKYRKKPVVVEAFQMTKKRRSNNCLWPEWLNSAWNEHPSKIGAVYPENFPNSDGKDRLKIKTIEGEYICQWNDYIIKGVNGELYPRRPDIFGKTYELVEEN